MVSALFGRLFHQKRFILCFIAIVAILFLSPVYSHTACAADVTLEWDPNPEPDIAGYEVFWGTSSGNYSDMIEVENYTSCTIGNLETGVTYYFAAKAYNTSGYRSDYSDEVTYTPAEPVADISVNPDIYYFGNVMVGDVSDVTLTVTNNGIADLHVGTIGGLSAPFSIVTDNCSGSTIPQGDSRTFKVRFAPAIDASFDDTITISSDDPDENPVSIAVHGTGTPEPLENQPPVADAGSNQTVNEGETVTLDGTSSYDSDDGIASYQWTQISGSTVNIYNPTSATPTFVAPNVGPEGTSLSFRLTVTDNGGLQSTDTCVVNVTWDNEPPVADAGSNQTVNEGTTVTLDGTASYDPDDGIASYQWTQIAGITVSLSNSMSPTPTFAAPNVGTEGASLLFQLTVTDNDGLQSTDTCVVNVTWDNEPPVADAGPNQTVNEGTTVTLDGTASYDPDDGIASYQWSQISGSTVSIYNSSSATPTFVAPNVGTEGTSLSFRLAMTDNGGLQSTDTCVVNVTDIPAEPVADISVDPNTHYFGNVVVGDVSDVTVTVTSNGIADLHVGAISGLSAPFSVVTDNCSGAIISQGDSRTFTVRFAPTTDTSFDDTVTIPSDDPDENPVAIVIHGTGTPVPLENQPPVADAGSNQTVNEGTTVTLDGTSSYDPDGTIESYRWTQTGGSLVTFSDPTDSMPTFVTPPVDSTGEVLEFQLTVTDSGGLENSSSMTVTIKDNGITIFSKDIISTRLPSGEAIGFREGKDTKLISLHAIEDYRIPTDANNEPLSLVYDGLIDMKIKVPVPGGEADITVYLDKSAPDQSTLYHYSRTDSSWSDYSDYAEFNATRNQIKITLVDGGMGDDDEVADGIIVDPFAFVLSSDSSTVPSSEDDEEEEDSNFNYGCFIGASVDRNFVDTVKGSKKQNSILAILLCGVVLGMRLREMFR